MSTTSSHDQAIVLAEFLRKNPSALTWSAEEIAQKAGVSVSMASIASGGELKRLSRNRGTQADPAFVVWFMKVMDGPTRDFHLASVISSILIGLAVTFRVFPNFQPVLAVEFALPVVAALAIVFHAVTLLRHGNTLKGIQGSIIFSVTLVISFLLAVAASRGDSSRSGPDAVAFSMSTAVILSMLHLALSLLFSQAGVWFRTEREQRDLSAMSRFDLLSRYLALHDKIRLAQADGTQPVVVTDHPMLTAFRQNALWIAFAAGFATTLLFILLPGISEVTQEQVNRGEVEGGVLLIAAILMLVSFCVQFTIAYFATNLLLAVGLSLVFVAGGYAVYLLPSPFVNPEFMREAGVENHIANLINAIIIGLLGGFGGSMSHRLAMRRRIQENQIEALLAESIEIQRLLTPVPKDVTVLVVDAVGSSSMKAESEPFEAEWSFRAYQMMLNEVVEEHQGSLFATAGDGATFFFDEPANALSAAREIQKSLHVFNEKVNRIGRQFRVRIGLHSGQVAGFIDDVEYSSVIDIAAHIEKVCRPGQVALSGASYDLIQPEDAQLQDLVVDDQRLYLVPGNGP